VRLFVRWWCLRWEHLWVRVWVYLPAGVFFRRWMDGFVAEQIATIESRAIWVDRERTITGPTLTTVVAGSSSSFPTLVVIFISSFPTFLTAEVSDTRTSSVVKSALYESFGSFKVGGTVGGNCGTWSGKICLVDSLWVERCHWR